jgi:hypothetical protein
MPHQRFLPSVQERNSRGCLCEVCELCKLCVMRWRRWRCLDDHAALQEASLSVHVDVETADQRLWVKTAARIICNQK